MTLAEGQWARNWDCCQHCLTTENPHFAKGLCKKCYNKQWHLNQGKTCQDCGNPVLYQSKRCQSCESKRRWRAGINTRVFTDEHRRNLSKAMKQVWQDEDYQCFQSKRTRQQWIDGCYDNIPIQFSTLELQVAAALDSMGIYHVSQYRPEGCSWRFDEFIPPDTLIEIQGKHWHSKPKQKLRDAEKARWAIIQGFHFTEILEDELNEQDACAILAQRI